MNIEQLSESAGYQFPVEKYAGRDVLLLERDVPPNDVYPDGGWLMIGMIRRDGELHPLGCFMEFDRSHDLGSIPLNMRREYRRRAILSKVREQIDAGQA